jgi:hypothetical protein
MRLLIWRTNRGIKQLGQYLRRRRILHSPAGEHPLIYLADGLEVVACHWAQVWPFARAEREPFMAVPALGGPHTRLRTPQRTLAKKAVERLTNKSARLERREPLDRQLPWGSHHTARAAWWAARVEWCDVSCRLLRARAARSLAARLPGMPEGPWR